MYYSNGRCDGRVSIVSRGKRACKYEDMGGQDEKKDDEAHAVNKDISTTTSGVTRATTKRTVVHGGHLMLVIEPEDVGGGEVYSDIAQGRRRQRPDPGCVRNTLEDVAFPGTHPPAHLHMFTSSRTLGNRLRRFLLPTSGWIDGISRCSIAPNLLAFTGQVMVRYSNS
jgi:hypothetical protein